MLSDWLNKVGLTERERALAKRMGLLRSNTLRATLSAYFGKRAGEKGFNEKSLAEALDQIAARAWGRNRKLLNAISRALRENDESDSLVLKQRKRGRSASSDVEDEAFYRALDWYDWVAEAELDSEKTEAVIAEICAHEGVSRATVFAVLREAEEYLALLKKLGLSTRSVAVRPRKLPNH